MEMQNGLEWKIPATCDIGAIFRNTVHSIVLFLFCLNGKDLLVAFALGALSESYVTLILWAASTHECMTVGLLSAGGGTEWMTDGCTDGHEPACVLEMKDTARAPI